MRSEIFWKMFATTYLNFFFISKMHFENIFPESILRGMIFCFRYEYIIYMTFESLLFANLIGNHVKTILIWYSYLCKYFTIKKQLLLVQIVYEFTITIEYHILTSCCIYSSDPQTTKVPLLSAPIPMRGNQSSHFLLRGKSWMVDANKRMPINILDLVY